MFKFVLAALTVLALTTPTLANDSLAKLRFLDKVQTPKIKGPKPVCLSCPDFSKRPDLQDPSPAIKPRIRGQ